MSGPPAAGPVPIRFAALGDSLTEGIGDPLPGGAWRGWAELLAGALGPPGRPAVLTKYARSGARSADTATDQLPPALRLRPQLAAVIVGGNDTLRSDFDIRRCAAALDTLIGGLTATGAVVLTACLPDPGRMLRLPALLGRPLARRMRAVNEVVHRLSARYDAVHTHLADHPVVADRSAWSVDRLHPSERGHRMLAREFHTLLTARGFPAGPPPSAVPDQPEPGPAADAWWLATQGTRWVAARSRDLLPGLLRLAAQEARHRLAGADAALDRALIEAARAALPAVATAPRPAPPAGRAPVPEPDLAPWPP